MSLPPLRPFLIAPLAGFTVEKIGNSAVALGATTVALAAIFAIVAIIVILRRDVAPRIKIGRFELDFAQLRPSRPRRR